MVCSRALFKLVVTHVIKWTVHIYARQQHISPNPLTTSSPMWLLLFTSFPSFNISDDLLEAHLKMSCLEMGTATTGPLAQGSWQETYLLRVEIVTQTALRRKMLSSGLLMGPTAKPTCMDFPAFVSSSLFFFFACPHYVAQAGQEFTTQTRPIAKERQ